ncbi:unnamed protein product [Calypogeia fissa]
MDATRGTLHERHHALHPDVLIVETPLHSVGGPGGEVRMQMSEVPTHLVDGDDEQGESLRLLGPKILTNSSSPGDQPEDNLLLHRTMAAGAADDVESTGNLGPTIPSLVHGVRSWDELNYRRFGGLPDDLDTLDIMREASRILRRQSDLFTSLAAALILPVSIIVLTHVVVTRPVINWTKAYLEVAVFEESVAAGIRTPYTKFMYLKIAEFLMNSVLDIPLAISLAALSKAGVVYTVAATYAGLKVSFMDVIYRVVPRVWLPLVITYLASLAIFAGAGVLALLFLGVANGVFAALHTSSAIMLLFFIVLGLTVCGVFVYLKIILNVANVICILEDKYGFAALARSFSILQGRVQVALGSYMVTFLCFGFVTLLFEYRVTDKNYYTEHNSSATWEGPLLILLHSFVYLFADIMITVLYYTCPKAVETSRVPEGVATIL